ncbi:hypothetical protein AB0M31_41410 [Streptomyces sp. NPDC051773]
MQRAQKDSEVAGCGDAGVAGGHLDEADHRVPPQVPFRLAELVERGRR